MRGFILEAVGVLCGVVLRLSVNLYAALGLPLTHSANFTFSIVPEPAPVALAGTPRIPNR